MAGQGAGPSRRSHTKSRKGCKTCKRRHIRCDETFPQCRNCTKHQVRCDYMEGAGSDVEGQGSPEQPAILLTPGSENRVEQWQQTGGFPYPDLQVFPVPPTQEYSKNDLRLLHHLSAISNDLMVKGTSNLTIWTQKMPKFLSIASSYPFVMHALLSFSANHLAWANSSTDCRQLHIQHGSTALRGLHDAIGSFSHHNADAVLAASLLMLWQATDWRSWSSLRAGIQSVLSTMQSWKHESVFAEFIAEEDLFAVSFQTHRRRQSVSSAERNAVLQNTIHALQRLRLALAGHENELRKTGELLEYVQQLQSIDPPESPDEQFNHLYYLRKWLFWVPVSLLQQQQAGSQGPALMTIAHFYSTALDLEPLFPDLGSSFCAALALPSLEAIFAIAGDFQSSQQHMNPAMMEVTSMLQHPQNAALNYRSRAMLGTSSMMAPHQHQQQQMPVTTISPDALSYTTVGNLSPAFMPSPLNTPTPQSSSSYSSSFLEVPGGPSSTGGFGYGTQSWGVAPSPGYPAYGSMSGDDLSYGGFRADGMGTPSDPEAGPSSAPHFQQQQQQQGHGRRYP